MTTKPETRIYAKDGQVIYEMAPWVAEALAIVLPASDSGFMEDFPDLLNAAQIARGNSPEVT